MSRTATSTRDCRRALWLLGLKPPVTARAVNQAWRARVARTHPDLHAASPQKSEAAATLTRALNEARDVLLAWLAEGRPWPTSGPQEVRMDEPEPWPEHEPDDAPAPVCRRTGLRAGDRVRTWPYDGDLAVVAGTETDVGSGQIWVLLDGAPAERAERVRLAAFVCPICGWCAGPAGDDLAVRPCPDCLVDLRRLERAPAEAVRVRRAIEARAEAGLAVARDLDDPRLVDRATQRRRWARRLQQAGPEDLHAALLAAFGRAYERWGAPAA
jgi:hypothetical protein